MIVPAALLLLSLPFSPLDSQGPHAPLQPTRYGSPSGEYVLEVDPSDRDGVGAATCSFARSGEQLWTKTLPITFCDAAVTDRGEIGGFGYSHGLAAIGGGGTFNVMILSAAGEVLLDRAAKRQHNGLMGGSFLPQARGAFAFDRGDRLVVRMGGAERVVERIWRTYRISTGEVLEPITPERPPLLSEGDLVYPVDVRAVPGTPLALAWWFYTGASPRSPSRGRHERGIFALHDLAGRIVWSLEMPFDYTVAGDREASRTRSGLVFHHGAIVDVAAPGRFRLWFLPDGKAVEFTVHADEAADSGWRVERGAETEHDPALPTEPVLAPWIELEPLGSAPLRVQTPPGEEAVTSATSVAIDSRGRILARASTGRVYVFDENGTQLFSCPPEPREPRAPVSRHRVAVDVRGDVYVNDDRTRERTSRFTRYAEEGRRVGFVELGSDEVVFDPRGGAHWARVDFRQALQRVGDDGAVQRKVERRSDRRWFGEVTDFDVTRGGRLVVLDGAESLLAGETSYLALHDLEGNPERSILLPRGAKPKRMAASERWVVAGGFGSEQHLVRVEDGATWRFDPCAGEENASAWRYGFSPDEGELWGVELWGVTLHRFALPE